jgi:pyruvate dehydrogenase (quinone)
MLAEAGAREVFGMTGDVINTLLEAIRNDDRFRWIGVRHEEHAAYAAAAQSERTASRGSLLNCGPGS